MTIPFYLHDCQRCQFLGNYILTEDKDFAGYYDLYWCEQLGTPTVIARWSCNGPDYMSGMPLDSIFYNEYPTYPTHEAYRRAKHRGLPVSELHPTGVTMLSAGIPDTRIGER